MTRRDLLKGGMSAAVLGAVGTLQGCGGGGSNNNITPTSNATTAGPVTPVPTPTPFPTFPQPPVRKSAGGLLNTSLDCRYATNSVGGTTIFTRTYEGMVGGPTLRVKPGDTLRVNLINSFPPNPDGNGDPPIMNVPHHPNSTNLHTHGLHVSPSGNSDNIFVQVFPQTSFQYEYNIPLNQPPGTLWYHPHNHGSASGQFFGGMGAALIIEGGLDDVPEVAQARDIVYLINELNINPQGLTPDFVGTNFPLTQRVMTVNGQLTPNLFVQPGEVFRLRVINASARTLVPFAIDGHDLHVAALDGITVPTLRDAATVNLSPANRADILVRAGGPGTYAIRKKVGMDGVNPDPELILGFLTVDGPRLFMGLPSTLPAPLQPITTNELTGFRTMVFNTTNSGGPPGFPNFTINGVRFDPNVVNQTVNLGAVEQWTLQNPSNIAHPFHIHINPFQVVSIGGVPVPTLDFKDTVDIPPNGGEVVIRSRFEDFTGLFVFHCHIIVHEDLGMMQTVNVV